ncbi:hypothetical protein DXG01_003261 [Tephrocybe rancida]|nr:hypothetical protein DXG01_003261 [Tephrocybe rancida]
MDTKDTLSANWDVMLLAIRHYFMNAEWIKNCTAKFERMTFRQSGFLQEMPWTIYNGESSPMSIYTRKMKTLELTEDFVIILKRVQRTQSKDLREKEKRNKKKIQIQMNMKHMLLGEGHFAQDCPHYGKWDSLCNTNLVTSELTEEQHQEWDREYIAMLAESKASSVYEPEPMESTNEISKTLDLPVDFDEEDLIKEVYTMDVRATGAFALHAHSIYVDNHNSRCCKTLEAKRKKKGKEALVSSSILSRHQCGTKIRTNSFEGPSPVASAGKTAANADEEDEDKGRPSTSKIAEVITAIKGRSLPDGYSSLGTRALHLRALVGSLDARPIQGRLDSGADITLMSEDYWKELADAPAIKEGIPLSFNRACQATTDGKFISFELEAYIVRDMRVPLLLGEDFQTTYELGVTRFSSGHCKVRVGRTSRVIPASSAQAIDLGFEIRKAHTARSFIRRQAVQHEKAKPCLDNGPPPVIAEEDVLLQASSVHNVRVSAPFGDQEHWLVEKVIIGLEDATVMAAPTTFINSSTPYIPIANPNPPPWFIRKGEVVGYLVDPATTCNKPKDEDIFKYAASAEALQTVIEGSLQAQDLVNGIARDPPLEEDRLLNDENWGPKTTAMPEEPLEGDVEHLVTLGPDILDDVRPCLVEVLH